MPFPYIDRAAFQRRPAVAVSSAALERRCGLLWVLMITAAENRGWEGDIPILDHRAGGLSIPSIVRPSKIATVEASRVLFEGGFRRLPQLPLRPQWQRSRPELRFPHPALAPAGSTAASRHRYSRRSGATKRSTA